MRAVDEKSGGSGGVVATRVGTRMAPTPVEGAQSSGRTTFAVGRLTWERSEIRVVEPRRLEPRAATAWGLGAAETVH